PIVIRTLQSEAAPLQSVYILRRAHGRWTETKVCGVEYRRLHSEGDGDVIGGAEAGVVSHCGIERRESLDPGENSSLADFEGDGFRSNDQGNDWSVYCGGSKWSRGKWILSHHYSGVSVAVAAGDECVIECSERAIRARVRRTT